MKKKQEYEYAGECNGNNGNGCFMDSPGHDCGCFTKVPKEEPKDNNFYEKLKQYFEETPREKVLEDWAKSAEYNNVGPTVDDFLNNMNKQETLEEAADKWVFETNGHKWSNNNNEAGDNFGSFIAGFKEAEKTMYSEEEMVNFAEFVATYADKNRNVNGEMLHAKSKYDGAERTIDLLEKWFEQFKKK
jgi:hypothetical protein